jgi:hypothetical protein
MLFNKFKLVPYTAEDNIPINPTDHEGTLDANEMPTQATNVISPAHLPPTTSSAEEGEEVEKKTTLESIKANEDINSIGEMSEKDVNYIVSSLPKKLQGKGRNLLRYLEHYEVKIMKDSFELVYEDGVIGSPLQSLIENTLLNHGTQNSIRLWDTAKFLQLLRLIKLPRSFFGQNVRKNEVKLHSAKKKLKDQEKKGEKIINKRNNLKWLQI